MRLPLPVQATTRNSVASSRMLFCAVVFVRSFARRDRRDIFGSRQRDAAGHRLSTVLMRVLRSFRKRRSWCVTGRSPQVHGQWIRVSIAVNALGPIEMLFNSARSNANETEVATKEKLEVSSKLQEAASAIGDAALIDLEQGKEVTVASAGGLSMNFGN